MSTYKPNRFRAYVMGIAAVGFVSGVNATALSAALEPHALPASPLLAIDQHRDTVVERIVSAWGEALERSGSGLTAVQLRVLLTGLRSDYLLAASLAGNLEGLRNVIASAVVSDVPVKGGLLHTKALGDTTNDLVYTPVTPCREVDTRNAGGPIASNSSRDFKVWVSTGGFTAQGGSVTNCGIPANPVAVAVNLTSVSPAGLGNLIAYPTGTPTPFASTLNYQLGTAALASGAIIPACVPNCANQVTVRTSGASTDLVIDIVGYFKAPSGAGNYFVQGGNALGTAALIGTTDEQPVDILVNGHRVMRYEPPPEAPNVIGGYSGNSANGQIAVTIAGGGFPGTGCGGRPDASCSNQVTFSGGTIGGGYGNAVNGSLGTVAGGLANLAIGSGATVGGGSQNSATAFHSTVAGGINNVATGVGDSTVGGGGNNTASGGSSVIAGGSFNVASGTFSAVGGGGHNVAGRFATVAGGVFNVAGGDYSFAAGRQAKANAVGAFAWADSQAFDFAVTAQDYFGVRATGGVGFTVGIDGNGSPTWYCGLSNGIAGWQCTSDRAAKENLADVDAQAIFDQLMAMPLFTWTGKGADPATRHLSPMAQDFHAAFKLGSDERTIASGDVSGVALAAIQGMNGKVQEQFAAKDAEIQTLQQQVAELQRTVEMLSRHINKASVPRQ